MFWRAVLALALAGLLVAAAPPANADVTRKKAMWGPVEVNGVSQFPIYADLGVGIFQMSFRWTDVAGKRPKRPRDPSDPAYRWPDQIDHAIEQATLHGIQVALTIQGSPRWANGGKDWRWAPRRAEDFADFAEAAARRFPRVRHWMIWGEPTKSQNFQPLPGPGRPLRGKNLTGPRAYARLLDASYRRLKRLSPRNLVIGGNTFTVGSVPPLRWIRVLKLPNGRPPRMDMWGHNPFSAREPNLSRPPLGSGYADFSDLDTLVRHLDRAMRSARLKRQRRLPIFISEYTLPTDHPNYAFNFHVSQATQGKWLTKALKITRRWSRIYTFGYFSLYDDARRLQGDQPEWGLIQRDGQRKPGYAAFKAG